MAFTDTLKQEFPITWKEFITEYIFSFHEDNVLNLQVGDVISKSFEKLPFDYQLGVILSFLEKYQALPIVDSVDGCWGFGVRYFSPHSKWTTAGGMNYNTALKTRDEAYQKAITKAFKLLEF